MAKYFYCGMLSTCWFIVWCWQLSFLYSIHAVNIIARGIWSDETTQYPNPQDSIGIIPCMYSKLSHMNNTPKDNACIVWDTDRIWQGKIYCLIFIQIKKIFFICLIISSWLASCACCFKKNYLIFLILSQWLARSACCFPENLLNLPNH